MKYTLGLCVFGALVAIGNATVPIDFLKAWKSSTNRHQCFRKDIEDNLGVLVIPETSVVLPGFDFKLWDFNLTGLADMEIQRLDQAEGNSLKVEVLIPYCEGSGSYKMEGNLFDLDFDGTGKLSGYVRNLIINYELKLKTFQINGMSYLKKASHEMIASKPDDDIYIFFDNLYPGNLMKTVKTNGILNEHINELFDLLIPIVEDNLMNKIDEVFYTSYFNAN